MNFATEPQRALGNKNLKKLLTAKYSFEKRKMFIFITFKKIKLCVLRSSVAMNFSGQINS